MKRFTAILALCFFVVSVIGNARAQDDETRQSSGLPMLIGENAANKTKAPLSGKLTVQGIDSSQTKPTLFVVVYFSGALIDKRQVNDTGYYYVPSVPREGAILAVEIDGVEVGRYQLPSSIMGNIKQDIVVNWSQVQKTKTGLGVLQAGNIYSRTNENERIFEKALSYAKDKKNDEAIRLFRQLVENDSKDFIAWTELGTLFFNNEKFSEAQEAYKKALEQKPYFIVALINTGKLFLAQKQPEKAIPVLTRAVETEATSADAQQYLGEAYLQAKKVQKRLFI